MSTKDPAFEKSRSIEDVQHLRLLVLLDEAVQDKGIMQTAQDLNVDHRTLATSLESGTLSRRMRGALEKALLEGGGSPAREQRERNDELSGRLERVEDRVEDMGREVSQGLAAVRGEVKALRNEHGQALQRVESRLAKVEAGGGDSSEKEEGESGPVKESPKRNTRLRREFPELATLEPAEDDEDVFGDAWGVIQEWRQLKDTHPSRGKGLDWLRGQERLLTVELALLEEHGLTLPPETYPLRGLDRGAQVNWRRKALDNACRRLTRREMLHRVGVALSFGALRRVFSPGMRRK